MWDFHMKPVCVRGILHFSTPKTSLLGFSKAADWKVKRGQVERLSFSAQPEIYSAAVAEKQGGWRGGDDEDMKAWRNREREKENNPTATDGNRLLCPSCFSSPLTCLWICACVCVSATMRRRSPCLTACHQSICTTLFMSDPVIIRHILKIKTEVEKN